MNGTDALTLMAKGVDPSRMLRLMAMCASGDMWKELARIADVYVSRKPALYTGGIGLVRTAISRDNDIQWLLEHAVAHISYEDYVLKVKVPSVDYTFIMPMIFADNDRTAYLIAGLFTLTKQ